MDVDALMDSYVQDVVRLLPRKQRTDVALELRELVREELQSRAAAQGRALDAAIALEGLRAFGRPQDVAARYVEPWTIIPPAETRRFAFAAIVGTLVLLALIPLGNAPFDDTPARPDVAIFAWLGVLVVCFGIQSFRQRRAHAASRWMPRGSDRANRIGSLALIALIFIGIVAYGAPHWLFAQLSHGHALPARLEYAPAFHASRLPVLFVLWGCQAALFAVLAIRGRWNPTLRRVDIGLEIGTILTLAWFLVPGEIFREPAINQPALVVIRVFISLMAIDAGVKLYRGLGRIPTHPVRSRAFEAIRK